MAGKFPKNPSSNARAVMRHLGITYDEYKSMPKIERAKAYNKSPEGKAKKAAYRKSSRGKRAEQDYDRKYTKDGRRKVSRDNQRKSHPERSAEYSRRHRSKPGVKEKQAAWSKEYRSRPDVKARHASNVAERSANKVRATPTWLNKAQHVEMDEMFLYNQLLPGKKDVDHIHPLQGFKRKKAPASGLHVPWNLQIMEKGPNVRKSNKMPKPAPPVNNPLSPRHAKGIDKRLLKALSRVGRGGLLSLPLAALGMFGKPGEAMAATEDAGYGLLKDKGFDVKQKIANIQNPILRGGAKTAEFLLGDVALATGLLARDLKAIEKSRKKTGKRIRRRPGMLAA